MSIYVGDKKALLLKSDNSVVEFYKGDKKLFGYDGKAVGAPLSIGDVHPAEHNVGVKVASKNLFDVNNATLINGYLASDNTIHMTTLTRSVVIECKPNTTYTVSKVLSARFGLGYTAEFPKQDTPCVPSGGTSQVTEKTITTDNTAKFLVIFLYHSNYDTDISVEDILNTLQVELGTTATSYTPYISNFAECENKIPYPYTDTTNTQGGITFTDNGDGSITVNGTAEWEEGVYFTVSTSIPPSSITAGEYILSGNPSSDCELVVFDFKDDGSLISIIQNNGTPTTFRLTDNAMITVVFRVNEGKSVNNVTITPQIVRKDAIKVEVARYGKNLFDNEKLCLASAYKTLYNFYYYTDDIQLLPNTTYTISSNNTAYIESGLYFVLANGDRKNTANVFSYPINNGRVVSVTFTTTESGVISFGVSNTANLSKIFSNDRRFQLELGTTATEYEPYKEPIIYTANADGTVEGVKSISPNMTLIPNSNAVTVECEYCKA